MKRISVFLALVLSIVFTCNFAAAQTVTADINGTISDPGGAVIPGATVTLTNVETNVAVSTVTNGAGIYSIRFVNIGQYNLTVRAKGFEQNKVGPFTLESGQIAVINSKLTLGAASTTVQVSGNYAPLINAQNGTVDAIIDSNTIQNIPLSGGNFNALTLYLPGAVTTSPMSIDQPGSGDSIERSTDSNDLASINGGRLQQNNYLLDGVEVNETVNNANGYNPYPDALGEIRVISANAPAEFGNVNGGDVLMEIQSGTNAIHGSASFDLQNYQLDANTWGNKHVNVGSPVVPRTPYTQSIFGGTLGGPIIKDKLFAFGDYEGARFQTGGVGDYTVLSPDMSAGNFSELLNPNLMCSSIGSSCAPNNLTQLYDPQTNTAGVGYGAPYYNNVICGQTSVPTGFATSATTSCANENPVFNYIVKNPTIYPVANQAPAYTNSANGGNFEGPSATHKYNNQYDIKIDWTPNKKDRISGRWMMGTAGDSSSSPILTTFPGPNIFPDKGVALNWVHNFNNALVNQATAGYSRIRQIPGVPTDPSGAFGLTGDQKVGINVTSQPFPGFANQNNGLSNMGTSATIQLIIDNTFQYQDILTWQKNKHLFKFGADFLRYQQNQFYPGNQGAMGVFNFSGAYTSNPAITGASTPTNIYPGSSYTTAAGYCATCNANGYNTADWELDRVNSDGIGTVTGNIGDRSWRSAYFAQDDWKLTPTLTLNIGVRYEYVQPIYEANNKQMNVLPVAVYGGAVTAEFAGSLPAAGLLPTSTNSAPINNVICPTRSCYSDPYNQIAPRVGFAYSVMHNLVLRGGYGMTNYMEGTGANLRLFFNPPYLPSSLLQGTSPSNVGTVVSPGTSYAETNGFGAGTANAGGGAGGIYRQWQQNMKPGVIAEYDLTTEYQLNNFSSFKIGYVGESGQHMVLAGAANQLPTPCVNNTNATLSDGTAPGQIDSNPSTSAYCITTDPAPYQALVGQAGQIVGTYSTGMMDYNGLQATYRQRATKGLEFTANYTYGRAMTTNDGFFGVPNISVPGSYAENYYNNHIEYGRIGEDVRHNLNATGVYELPFGRGKQFGSNVPFWMDEVIGGWKYSQTAIAYSGFPVDMNANNNAYTDNQSQRANWLRQPKITGHNLNNWWGTDPSLTTCQTAGQDNGTCAYGQPADGTYGNSKVGALSAPGYRQFNLSLFKTFTIYKQQKLAFRANMYNFSNTNSWSEPNTNINSSTFGAITGVLNSQRQIEFGLKYNY